MSKLNDLIEAHAAIIVKDVDAHLLTTSKRNITIRNLQKFCEKFVELDAESTPTKPPVNPDSK